MCYMVEGRDKVGVRELRQNLSVYLRRVEKGETLEVTERGRPVAVLAPLAEASTALGRLISSGRASVPEGELLDLGPPPRSSEPGRLRKALDEGREDRL